MSSHPQGKALKLNLAGSPRLRCFIRNRNDQERTATRSTATLACILRNSCRVVAPKYPKHRAVCPVPSEFNSRPELYPLLSSREIPPQSIRHLKCHRRCQSRHFRPQKGKPVTDDSVRVHRSRSSVCANGQGSFPPQRRLCRDNQEARCSTQIHRCFDIMEFGRLVYCCPFNIHFHLTCLQKSC